MLNSHEENGNIFIQDKRLRAFSPDLRENMTFYIVYGFYECAGSWVVSDIADY